MRPGARAQAAIDILTELGVRRRPAANCVKDWMLSHRFAGSKDRAEIGDLVFGALRWKASSAWRLDADLPRAWVFGAQRCGFGWSAEQVDWQCYDDPHAPPPPTESERAALAREDGLDDAPAWVRGDYPEWLDTSLTRAFGDERAAEGAALARPAPLDLRANALKTDRAALIEALAENPRLVEPPKPTPHAPLGVRIPWARGRTFPCATEQAFLKGWFEVQDEGSQLAALLAGARPRPAGRRRLRRRRRQDARLRRGDGQFGAARARRRRRGERQLQMDPATRGRRGSGATSPKCVTGSALFHEAVAISHRQAAHRERPATRLFVNGLTRRPLQR